MWRRRISPGCLIAQKRDVAFGHLEFAQVRPPGSPKVKVVHRLAAAARGHRHRHRRHAVSCRLGDPGADPHRRRDQVARPSAVRGAARSGRSAARHSRHARRPRSAGRRVRRIWMHIEVAGPADANAEEVAAPRHRAGAARRSRRGRGLAAHARARSLAAAESRQEPPHAVPASEVAEVAEFLRWLADDHFTFLGCRDYRLVDDEGVESLAAVAGHRARSAARRPAAAAPAHRPSARSARAGARSATADHHQDQRALDRAPRGPSRLHRHQVVRPRRCGRRRAPLPGPVHLGRLRAERLADSAAAAARPQPCSTSRASRR